MMHGENQMMKTLSKKKQQMMMAAAGVVMSLFSVCAMYVNDYYRADSAAIAAFAPESRLSAGAYLPEEPFEAGLIFYPGGKVESAAYAPLMEACAAEGILCVPVEMPLRLAVLDVNAADGIRERFPEVERWYIGGHSLGGSMAAAYLGDHAADFAGLILLGSYATEDLSDTALEVLSVYGSEDQVLNREKYEENRGNLPAGVTEVVIDGGCHAGFGMYGPQDGDGTPTLTAAEQIRLTAEAIGEFAA